MKQIEDILTSSLKLIQIMAYSSVDEIIQFAIDEGSRLTGSKIGYFHFVNPDQKTIDLKTWSNETLKTCDADEKTSHYPIDEAGVWVDCIYQKKAVIHNDYESLPHKKGLPEGHVPLKRDMAVPVIEDGKTVAIIGVGNKEGKYNQFDIDRLTLLAENTWIILQRKRAEEENMNHEKLQAVLASVGAACHELTQPMQTISGYSELLLMAVSEEHPLYEKIRKIREQIDRMKKITTKLMGATRYETKVYSGNTQIIDLDNIKERRKHKRFIPCDRTSVIGECGSSEECQIIDISMGGLAIWCKESQNHLEDFAGLSIKMKNISSNLDKIPCNVIENLKTNKSSKIDNKNIERYSIQFGEFTPKQTDHLEYFIHSHTSALFFSRYSSNLLVNNFPMFV
jgi:hypothetical protein